MEKLDIVSLLRVAWFLSTFPVVAATCRFPNLPGLHGALLALAKRGKISQSSNKLTVPQRFFFHFYMVGILWTTILLVAIWFYATTMLPSIDEQDEFSTATKEHVYNVRLCVFMLLLMETHVTRRFYESLNVFNYSPSARMHVAGYITGIFYYIAMPLSLCCNVAPHVLDFVNGKNHINITRRELNNIWMFVAPLLRLLWYTWIGAAIFLWGSLHQFRCHKILGSLRKKTGKTKEYVIPYGDWFEYVSSPHYTAEIVIYGGLVVASGGQDLTLWLLFAFVVANLGFTATITHRWYIHKFDNYPRNRCAVFPFVY